MIANIIRNANKYSATGDPYYSAVSLMLSMDGTNGSTTFTDSSLNALTVTPVGNAQISTTQSKFGAASGYFDGTGDSLTIPANTALALGAGDYTIEGWFYSLTSGTSQRGMIDFRTATTGTNGLMLRENNGGFLVYLNNATILSTTTGRIANQWQHVSLVRNGTTVTLYVDGVLQTSVTSSTNLTDNILRISGFIDTQSSPYAYNGYMDEIRITKYARYVSNFTPPTAALPTTASSTVADPYYNYTSLLLHMDGADTSTNFVDSGPNALAVTRTGTPAISTAQSKYGGSSVAFSGSTDRLGVASNALFAFGTGDFTVEFWVYFNSISTSFVQLYDTYVTGGFSFYWSGSASTLIISNRSVNQIVQAWSPSANTWYHLAVSRSGTSLRLFINGTVLGSTTASTSYVQGALQIGGTADNTSYSLNGYIDDLRITKYARYTSAFTPPASAFPNA